MNISQAIDSTLQRIKKPNTKAAYGDTFRPFGIRFGPRTITEVLPSEIREFVQNMPVSDATKHLRISHLNVLFNDAINSLKESRQEVFINPVSEVHKYFPKPKRNGHYRISGDIQEKVKEVRDKLTRPEHLLAFDLGFKCALRVSEILNLRPVDLVEVGVLRIKDPKSGFDFDEAPCPVELWSDLHKYTKDKQIPEGDRIFKMSRQAFWGLMTRRGFKPHDLRRYGAFSLRERGKSLTVIKNVLRHSSPKTTEIYLGDFDMDTLRKEIEE